MQYRTNLGSISGVQRINSDIKKRKLPNKTPNIDGSNSPNWQNQYLKKPKFYGVGSPGNDSEASYSQHDYSFVNAANI